MSKAEDAVKLAMLGRAANSMLCPVLVGREEQARALQAALDGAMSGAGRVVVLLGEAGVGKSRLARELANRAHRHCTVLTGRAVPGLGATGLRAFADALQPAFRTRRAPDADEIRPFVAALARLVPDWRSEAMAAPSDPVIVAEGVLRLLRLLASRAASVLVLEDLHWADAETLAVIEYMADHAASEPLLCVLTCRTAEHSPGTEAIQALIDRRAVETIRLARLDAGDAIAMARACLASDEVPLGLEELVSRAEGIPFLVEELLASAAAVGALAQERDGWKLTPSAKWLIPATFADGVRQRISGLGQHAEAVLRAAAIFGRAFEWTLLGPAVKLTDETVVAVLRGAQDQQLIERDRSTAQTGFRFRHALTRDAILGEMLSQERAAIAARALEVVETHRPGLPGGWCDTAIGLAETAGLEQRAAELLLESASRAVAAGALGAAEAILEKARQRAQTQHLRTEVDVALLDVLAQAGNTDRVVPVAERLLTLLDQLGADEQRRAAVHLNVARAFVAASRWRDATEHLDKARRLSTVLHERTAAASDALMAEVAMGQQELIEARRCAHSALEIAQAHDLADVACQALEVLGRAARVHDLDSAERYFGTALRLAERQGLVVRRVRALHELGTIGMLRGHHLEYLEQASELALQTGALSTAAVVNLQLAAAYVYDLQHETALRCARRSADIAAHLGLNQTHAVATAIQATAHALAGRRGQMETTAAEAFALARGHPDIYGQVWGNARGIGALLHEDRATALTALDEAMTFLRDPRCTVPGGIIGPFWALLHSLADDDATAARQEIRSSRAAGIPIARALLGYADAVALGRAREPTAPMECFRQAESLLSGYEHLGIRPIGLRLVAEAALDDGWGEPVTWLMEALAFFEERGFLAVAAACRGHLVRAGAPLPRRGRGNSVVPIALRARGITSREVDVLTLVMAGLSNKQIGERLYLSPKTVEKHIEHLMDKLSLSKRMELAAAAASAGVAANYGSVRP